MKLLVDEDTQSKRLLRQLEQAGHDVQSVNSLGQNGMTDDEVFALAQQHQRVILTHNCGDFQQICQREKTHCGVVGIFRERVNKFADAAIIAALQKLEDAIPDIADQFQVLNQWK